MNDQNISKNLEAISLNLKKFPKAHLIAVSKSANISQIESAYELNIRDFAENRVQVLKEKSEKLPIDIRWHFIGAIQSNKIKELFKISNLYALHSVHSFSSLKMIYKKCDILKKTLKFFLQVNISEESEKSGFLNLEDLYTAGDFILEHESQYLFWEGLMGMGPIRTNNFEQDTRKSFQVLKSYRDLLNKRYSKDLKLSMGMSQDYKIALEEESDYIRVGSNLFIL